MRIVLWSTCMAALLSGCATTRHPPSVQALAVTRCSVAYTTCCNALYQLLNVDFGRTSGLSPQQKAERIEVLKGYKTQLEIVLERLTKQIAAAEAANPSTFNWRIENDTTIHSLHDCYLPMLKQRINAVEENISRLSEREGETRKGAQH